MNLINVLYFAIAGLITGSYLNVLIYRIPRGIPSSKGFSFCPACGHRLSWADLVPVLSYIVLRARCRYCDAKIHPRYPAVELLTGFCFILLYLKFGISAGTFIYAAVISCLITLSVIDFDNKIIPDRFNIIIGICGLLLLTIPGGVSWYERLIGMFAVSVPLLVISFFTGGIGEGDVKLFAACGLVLGWKLILLSMFLASVMAAIFGIALMAARKAGRKTEMPFGPFIALAVMICIFAGQNLLDIYLAF